MLEQTPTPDETPTVALPSADASPAASDEYQDGSLDAHEQAFSPTRETETPEPVKDRDTAGRFQKQPRRRAASQQATPDDVPTINALTARLKAIEETHGKDIARQDGESDRVYGLRRRAELLERLTKPAPPVVTPPVAATPVAPVQQPVSQQPSVPQARPAAPTFPTWDQWRAMEGNADKDYDDYRDDREEFRYQVRRAIERDEEQQRTTAERRQTQATAHQQRVAEARAKYADWDAVVTPTLPISRVIFDAVLASDKSADVQYWLGQHRDELAALVSESQEYSSSAVTAMRRYLDARVAAEQRPSPIPARVAAGSTGSAPVRVEKPVPPPPNPVRTGAMTTTDEAPPADDSMSLAAHESFYGKRRRA